MRSNHYFRTFIFVTGLPLFASVAYSQDAKAPDAQAEQRPAMKRMHDNSHAMLLHQLGLSEEQMQQIRKLHMDQKAHMDEAQKRLRDATRALNEAIYAVNINESDVESRIRERQAAQAEVDKLRFMTELAVRRILTPDQLVRFRELRQQFEQRRRSFERRRDSESPLMKGGSRRQDFTPGQPAPRKQNFE